VNWFEFGIESGRYSSKKVHCRCIIIIIHAEPPSLLSATVTRKSRFASFTPSLLVHFSARKKPTISPKQNPDRNPAPGLSLLPRNNSRPDHIIPARKSNASSASYGTNLAAAD